MPGSELMEPADLYVCRFGDSCASQPQPGTPADAEGRGICYSDEMHARHAIGQLPRLHTDLLAEIAEPVGRGLDTVGGGRVKQAHAPSPVGEGYDVAAREIEWVLQTWAIPVWDRLHPQESERGAHIERIPVPAAAALLVEHFPALRSLQPEPYRPYIRDGECTNAEMLEDDGPGAVVQLTRLYHRSRSILGSNARLEARALPCPRPVPPPLDDPEGQPGGGCGQEGTLAREIGKNGIRCVRCGWSCTEREYDLYALTFVPPNAWRRLEGAR